MIYSYIKIRGDFACFTRPEFKTERVSYDFITPTAACGILRSIYGKPQFNWVVQEISVRKPICFINIVRNELKSKIKTDNVKKSMKSGEQLSAQLIADDRTQRNSLILKDVEYIVKARTEVIHHEDDCDPHMKHKSMLERRLTRGSHFRQPTLGMREFWADCRLSSEEEMYSENPHHKGTKNFGKIVMKMNYETNTFSEVYDAKMVDGIVKVGAE